jgi:hypothetical protein
MSCKFSLFFLQNRKNGNKNKIVIDVIGFDSIKIYTDWTNQNDHQNLSFVKYINVVGEKLTGNCLKMSNL